MTSECRRAELHGAVASERGTTLLEAAFTLALFGSTIALVGALLSEEASRQRSNLLGRDILLMTEAARSFAEDEYETLQRELAAVAGTDAIMEVGMQRLVDADYLPAEFMVNGGRQNSLGQDWILLVRGVNRTDAARPPATLQVQAIDADSDGMVDPELMDGLEGNGELDLEIVLATTGGDAAQAQEGNPAIVASGLPTAGFVQDAGTARGPYGNWEMDIAPFLALDGDPAEGRFASLIAVSGLGVLDFEQATNAPEAFAGNPFDRCPGAAGALLGDCSGNNQVHTQIVFDPFSGNRTGADAGISGLFALDMHPPVDSDADGTPDLFSAITGPVGIACDETAPTGLATGTLIVDCTDVEFTGALSAEGSVTAETFLASSIGGQDLSTAILSAHLVALDPAPEIEKPDCGSSSASIYAVPVSFVSPDGTPLVGVQAFASTMTDSAKWTVSMRAAIDRDDDADGSADLIDLDSSSDLVLALTKCE